VFSISTVYVANTIPTFSYSMEDENTGIIGTKKSNGITLDSDDEINANKSNKTFSDCFTDSLGPLDDGRKNDLKETRSGRVSLRDIINRAPCESETVSPNACF
jgi:hypothetical protein